MPDVPHHVTQRGNRRQEVFFCPEDYEAYRELMAHWCRRCGVAVWAYDSKGARTSALDERGNATYYTHNSAGLRTSIKDALGHARYFDYDGDGNRHLEIDQLGRATYFDYDVFRRRQGPRGPLPFCGLSRPFLRRCRDAQPPRCVPSS